MLTCSSGEGFGLGGFNFGKSLVMSLETGGGLAATPSSSFTFSTCTWSAEKQTCWARNLSNHHYRVLMSFKHLE
jgi:hypothetical protein